MFNVRLFRQEIDNYVYVYIYICDMAIAILIIALATYDNYML